MPRTACLALAAAVLAGLSLPAAALGQGGVPTLKEAPGSAFPDRQYLLRLPSPQALQPGHVTITENGRPPAGQVGVEPVRSAAEPTGTRRSSEYLVTYRSVLPPEVPAEVRARVDGLPAASARYTTPQLVIEPRGAFQQSRLDGILTSPFLMVVLVSVLALWVFARARATRSPD